MKALRLALALLIALAAACAFGEQVLQSDPNHTFAWFQFDHLGLSIQRDRFDKVDATVHLDTPDHIGSVQARIQVDSLSTGSAFFNKMLLGDAFFDAAKFPEIRYASTAFHFGRFDDVTRVDGNLTIKGITRPVTLTVTNYKCMLDPQLHRPICGLNAMARIERSDFDLGKYVPFVSNDVMLYVSIEAIEH
ncbi:MAG: polyisoprenoid-binding protein [Proteobacteria bacterium]|nr:polyisoprenoid-binding protein [Pseudomonadota bacterium]